MMAVRRLTLSPPNELARTVEAYKETAEQVTNRYDMSILLRAEFCTNRNILTSTCKLSSTMVTTEHLQVRLQKANPLKQVPNVSPQPRPTRNPHPKNLVKLAHLGMCLEMDPQTLKLLQPVVLPLPRFLLARSHDHSLLSLLLLLFLNMLYRAPDLL